MDSEGNFEVDFAQGDGVLLRKKPQKSARVAPSLSLPSPAWVSRFWKRMCLGFALSPEFQGRIGGSLPIGFLFLNIYFTMSASAGSE